MSDTPELNEEELLALNIGIVPAIDSHVPIAPETINVIQAKDGSVVSYSHDHVFHYFETQVYDRIMNMSQENKDRYFKMVYEYSDIIEYILNDDNNILFNYSQRGEQAWLDLEKHAEKSGMVIDYERPRELIRQFDDWRKRNNLI